MFVHHFPDQQIGEARLRGKAMRLMAPFRRQSNARRLRTLVLDDTEQQIADRPDQSRDGQCAASQHRGQDHQAEQRQREQRVDDGDVVPGHPMVGERPQELRSVRGAGVQQAMRGIAEQARQIGLPGLERTSHERMQRQRHKGRPDGDEQQCMCELAVVFEKQQRVRRRIDEYVEIRRHARNAAEERDGAELLASPHDLRCDRAERALTDGVHVGGADRWMVYRVGAATKSSVRSMST